MVALRGNFSDILAPGLAGVVALAYRQYPEEYTKIFDVETSKRQYEDTTTIEGIGMARAKAEGTLVAFEDLTQGYNNRYTHTTYALGMEISREMYDDDLYSVMKKAAKYLGISMKRRKETDGANVFNNAFNVLFPGADAVALCDLLHPFARGGTGRNELTTAADLSEASLRQALTDIETTTDAAGTPMSLIAKKLLVAPANRWTASVLLESQLKSGTANNDKNVFLDTDLTYIVNHYLTDADAFFLICDQNELVFYNRMSPKFENDDDFDTKNAKFSVCCRHSTGWADWPGVFGSPGV